MLGSPHRGWERLRVPGPRLKTVASFLLAGRLEKQNGVVWCLGWWSCVPCAAGLMDLPIIRTVLPFAAQFRAPTMRRAEERDLWIAGAHLQHRRSGAS